MAEKKMRPSKEFTRRDFLKSTGLLVGGTAIGSSILLAACASEPETKTVTNTKTSTVTATKTLTPEPISIPKSGYIEWNPEECAACSRCLMACAAIHEGAISPALSAIKWEENDYLYGFRYRKPLFCQQCTYPECYFACPQGAIEIDETTGARYINEQKCDGCGICVEACPFDPPRINIDRGGAKAIKCDLCKDRANGPACVEVCNRQALKFITAERRVL
jgi:Fe-S-cluster-containing hydrogenase component 2